MAAGPFGSNLRVSSFVDSGFPIIDGANLKGFEVTDNITKFVTKEKAYSLKRSIAKRGDVVITISGNVGQIAYIPNDSKYEEYLCSQRQFKVTFDKRKVYPPYLVFYFHTHEGRGKILSFANQVGVPALSQPLKNFRAITIDLPELGTQKRIASVIETFNRKIKINQKINDNLSKQAMAFYQDMFANRGFPVKPLDELFDISIGKTPPRKEFQWFSDTEGIKWASIANLGSCGTYIRETSERITEEAVKKFNIPVTAANTVLLSFKLTVGRVAITDEPMCTNEAIASFDEENHSLTFYLYCFLKEFKFQTLGSTSSIATAVNSKIIKKIPLPVPPQSELEMFNALVTPIFEQIRDLERENKHLSDMRDILLPKLLKGEL